MFARHRWIPLALGLSLLITLTGFSPAEAQPPDASPELAAQGSAVAKKFCYGCHGAKFNGSAEFNVLDPEALLNSAAQYVAPGSADDSYMWQRVRDGEMPPEGQPQPGAEEKELLRRWIEAGAPKPARESRPFKSEADVLEALLADLRQLRPDNRRYFRYFTLTHLYNDHEGVSEFDLRLYRAALSKAVNSLTWSPEIAPPKVVDDDGVLLRIDLRELDWDDADWRRIVRAYPYGLRFHESRDPALAQLARQVQELSGGDLPYLRADWFTVTVTRPPLYHDLLEIPETDKELERQLRVDVDRNLRQNRAQRAGFTESGVSTANRLVERHPAITGYYWKSYDFKPGNADGNLFRKPLGPVFRGNAFDQFAFEHDGGEQIFSLPNGMQGYMLIDGKGKQIAEGPTDVVRDLKEISGSVAVVNGLSCMHCHQHGMIRFQDTVRTGTALSGDAREKVLDLFPRGETINERVEADRRAFLDALEQATGPFLQIGDDREKPIEQFAEPIGAVARYYSRDLTLREAALELGLENPERLKFAIEDNTMLRALGLGPLAGGNAVERSAWEDRTPANLNNSTMQMAARALGCGTPLVILVDPAESE